MPLYLNALTGKSVILVTVNDYLAKRDAEEMGPVYRFMGLTVSAVGEEDWHILTWRTIFLSFLIFLFCPICFAASFFLFPHPAPVLSPVS